MIFVVISLVSYHSTMATPSSSAIVPEAGIAMNEGATDSDLNSLMETTTTRKHPLSSPDPALSARLRRVSNYFSQSKSVPPFPIEQGQRYCSSSRRNGKQEVSASNKFRGSSIASLRSRRRGLTTSSRQLKSPWGGSTDIWRK